MSELRTYVKNNRHLIPNYGERYRNREPIATGFVEATVNKVVSRRLCKRQQMAWSKEGAICCYRHACGRSTGNLAGIFKRWYPDLDVKAEAIPIAACPPTSPCSRHSDHQLFDLSVNAGTAHRFGWLCGLHLMISELAPPGDDGVRLRHRRDLRQGYATHRRTDFTSSLRS